MIRTSPEHKYWVGVPIPILSSVHNEPVHGAVLWQFSSLWTNPFFFDYRPWLAVIFAVALISVACWLPLIRGLTRAIGQVTRATAQIADGHFEIALPTTRGDELGQLSGSINRMARRLSDLVQGQKRFLSDIAHELCSPVARMQVALGILQNRADADTIGYVNDASEEATHVTGLINELLSFSKAEIGTTQTQLTRVNVAEMARRVVEREGSDKATVETEIDPELEVIAQPEYLYRSLANLVRNAIRYASNSGPILLSARHAASTVSIFVSDRGPGLPESELEMCSNLFTGLNSPDSVKQEARVWD
jgi:signal transduction histidine kinase